MLNNNLPVKLLVVITFILMLVVNALATILPINGVNPGQVSDSYPNLFAPAGITFSIWGVIYLLLGLYTLYQLGIFRNDKTEKKEQVLAEVNRYFILTSLANTLWIFSWHYRYIGISVILISLILVALIKISMILKGRELSKRDKLFMFVPFSVYFGWITVATIANITVWLVSTGWNGFGIPDQTWTIIILLVGAVIGTVTTLKNKSIPYGLVLIWAYLGILLKHTSVSGYNSAYQSIIGTLIFCIAIFILAEGYLVIPSLRTSAKSKK